MRAEEIKYFIGIRGLTQKAIADSLGISGACVSRVIHGKRKSQTTRIAIANFLGMSVDALFPQSYDEKNKKIND